MQIKYIRRTTQIIFFILIIYGGYLISLSFNIEKNPLPRGTEGEVNLIDKDLPFRTCRYIEPKPMLFRACSLRYILNLPLYWQSFIAIFIPLFVILILYFVFGRFMCGWMCPLGFTSDIMTYSRKKLGIKRLKPSLKINLFFRYWRYSFLLFLFFAAIALVLPIISGMYMTKSFSDLACQVCPSRMIFPLFAGKPLTIPTFVNIPVFIFSLLSFVFLFVFILGVAINRSWCRICPNGSFASLFNKGCLITKEKDSKKCTKCGICERVCPLENKHVYKEKKKKIINNRNCIMCFKCIDKCPEDNCLKVKFLGKEVFKSKFKKLK